MQERKYLKISNDIFFEQVLLCLKENKKVKMFVQGNSMFPFLWNGDEVLLSPAQPKTLKRGDIVLAKTEIGIILHRIIRLKEDLVVLAGDGNVNQVEHAFLNEVYAIVQCGYRNDSSWNVSSTYQKLLWLLWRFFRPLRRLLIPIIKTITKQHTQNNYENKR